MKKLIYSVILCSIILFGGISVNAATSDALNEIFINKAGMAQSGVQYNSPFIVPESQIDTTTGAVTVKEVDLSLPGKNGFDLNLYREYSSYNTNYGYYYYEFDDKKYKISALAVPYTATVNGVKKTYYVECENEAAIKETLYTTTSGINNMVTDEFEGKQYIKESKVSTTSGAIELTWDKNTAPFCIRDEVTGDRIRISRNGGNVKLGNGWSIIIPSLQSIMSYTVGDYGDRKIDTFYAEIGLENGQKETLKYTRRHYYKTSTTDEYDEINEGGVIVKNNYGRYKAEISFEFIEDSRGFTYNMTLKRYDGTTYYFLMSDPAYSASGKIQAISDKYGNTILYEKISDGWLITDTYGRKVTVTASGIQVSAGDISKSISYETTRNYSEIDPNQYYYTFHTNDLTVTENDGSGNASGVKQTVYKLQNKCINPESGSYSQSEDIVPLLLEVDYPTNAKREYSYEDEPNAGQFYSYLVGTSKSYYNTNPDYYMYKVTGEMLYENGVLKSDKAYTYTGEWSPNTTLKIGTVKTMITTETLENGTVKTTKDETDDFGRVTAKEISTKGTESHTLRTEYNYFNGTPENSIDESLSTLYNIRNGNLRSIVNYEDGKYVSSTDSEYNEVSRQPEYIEFGESRTNYTYDETYYMPLTVTENRLDDTDFKQVNTLTSDKKSIARTVAYDGTTVKKQTNYTYNSDGTVSKTVAYNYSGNVTTDYSYTYADDCSYTVTATVKDVEDADGNKTDVSTTVGYDPLGRKISETDANGNTTRYEYDLMNHLTKQINPDGTYKQFSYDIPNNKVTATDEMGNITTEAYTPLGNIESIYHDNDPNKKVMSYTYDNLGRKTSETTYMDYGEEGMIYEYTYDDLDRVVTETNKGSKVFDTATFSYTLSAGTLLDKPVTADGYDIDVTDYKKAEVLFYDSSVSSSQSSGFRLIRYDGTEVLDDSYERYQVDSMILDLTDVNTLTFDAQYGSYDIKIRLIPNTSDVNMVGGASRKTTVSYTGDDTYVKPTSVTVTDGYGNKVEESFYNGTVSTANLLNRNKYKYDLQGNLLESVGGRVYMESLGDYSTKTEYDYAGRPTKEYRADGNYITTEYDKLGNVISTTDYMGNTTAYAYDKLGRQISVTAPFEDGITTQSLTYYDKNGNIIMSKQQNNKIGESVSYTQTENEYDSRNRLVSTKVNDGTRDVYTQYAYDSRGNMTKTVTGHTEKISDLYGTIPEIATYTEYEYDRFGNVTKETDSLGNSRTAEYNLYGVPTMQTDKNGEKFYYSYNEYGSPTWIWNDDDSYESAYSYNVYNIPIVQWDFVESKLNRSEYDAYGYVTEEQDVKSKLCNIYTNDVNGNRKRLEVKDNDTVVMTADYTYDILDRLTNVSFDGGSASVSYTYDANGNMLTETKNGDITEYAYNAAGLLKTQTGGDCPDYTMTYRLDGNKVGETDSVNGYRSYVYDGIGQLKNETLSNNGIVNSSISYTYDTRGNRISSNDNGTICNYTYDRNNRLINDDNGIRTNSYAYDKNGNMVSRLSGTYIDADKAVAENVSINVFGESANQAKDISNSTAVYYTYDAVNKLKGVQSDDGMTAAYGYDAKGRRISKTVNGITTTQSWDGDYIIREKDSTGTESARYYRGHNLVANKTNGTVNYYCYDPHGSVVSIGGKTYTYDAFGNQTNDNADDTNPFRYCGEYYDNETGYIYLRARYYDPSIGRFTTEDPIKDGLNWYVYCSNNPVMFIDPSGYLRGPGPNHNGEWSDNPDRDDYGEGSKIYVALCRLTEAYEAFPEYHSAIADLANEMRWIGNEWGSSKIDEELAEILEIKQAQSLNTVEQVLAAAYKREAITVQVARVTSDMLTKMIYNEDGNGTNEANAFKHIYWSAYTTSEIGGTYTKLFLNAHEFGWYDENLNNPEAMKMDLHNNQRGRYLGSLDSRKDLLSIVLNDMADGNSAILVNGKSVLTGR